MPTYCYRCPECDRIAEHTCTFGDRPEWVLCPHCEPQQRAVRKNIIQPEHGRHQDIAQKNWPMKSEALGVHPDQIPTVMEQAKRKGVPTDFTEGGAAIFRDRDHRARYCKRFGYYDKDAGYGDQT